MGGAPRMPAPAAPPPPPPPPVAETDPAIEKAKEDERARLAARKTSQDTIMTGMTPGGFMDTSDPALLKTKLGGV